LLIKIYINGVLYGVQVGKFKDTPVSRKLIQKITMAKFLSEDMIIRYGLKLEL